MGFGVYSNDHQEWVNSLKVGDMVAINLGRYGYKNYTITTIEKITPTGIIKTGNGRSYNNDGWERGKRDAWGGRTHLEPVTQKVVDKVETDKLLSKINKVKFTELPLEILREVVIVISRVEGKQNEK